MNVILLEPVGSLGNLGEEVTVKAGYARNFLLPRGVAVRATKENREMFEARRAELERAAAERRGEAEGRAYGLADMAVSILVKAGEEGRLFGSVGTQDIADAVTAKGVEVAKSEVKLPEGVIRQVGDYEVDIQLDSEVTATIKVAVIAE